MKKVCNLGKRGISFLQEVSIIEYTCKDEISQVIVEHLARGIMVIDSIRVTGFAECFRVTMKSNDEH